MATEELFVNAFDGTFLDWSETGDSPYLNDSDDNWISEGYTGTDKEGYFDFANSGVGVGTINSVKVSVENNWLYGVKTCKLFVWNGSAWVDKGVITPDTEFPNFSWIDVDVSAEIDSWAKIDGCRVYFEEIGTDNVWYIRIRRCKLKVDYGAAPPAAVGVKPQTLVLTL